jgi:uncharacterized protein (DUF1015 family)
MPEIQAFHGLRYDLGHVGALSDVVAPPYDVIDASFQDELYKRHPANVIRLILNREEPGDADASQRYGRAAQFLRQWRSEGVLQREPVPAFYVYHQMFEHEGQTLTRRGFMCRVRLERFGEGKIFPHEETHAAAKADRLNLIRATRANLSQVFGLYPDPSNQAQSILEHAIEGQIPLEATDHLGVVHHLWAVTDIKTIADLSSSMNPRPVFIADGHHRYETACNYRDQLPANEGIHPGHAANYVMMMCVGMSDPGMAVLPTHRLFRGLPSISSRELAQRLDGLFTVRIAGQGPDHASDAWTEIQTEDQQGVIGLFAGADQRWLVARIIEAGQARMAEVAADRSADWQGLGVSILQRLVVETLLEQEDLPKPLYVHSVHEVIDHLERGDQAGRDATGQQGLGGPFPLAALVMPATLEHIRSISEHGERMPAKSTYFYPKLLSGLVVNPLD